MCDRCDYEAGGLADSSTDVCRIATVLHDKHMQVRQLQADRDALLEALKNLCRGGSGNRAKDWDDAEKAIAEASHG